MAARIGTLGLFLGVLGIFALGCQDDGAGTTRPSSIHTVHFNLGTGTFLPQGEDYHLHVAGERHKLVEHDAASRALFANLADDPTPPTHYAEDVELPDDRLVMMYVTQRTNTTGALDRLGDVPHGLAAVALHIPQKAREAAQALILKSASTTGKLRSALLPLDPTQIDNYDYTQVAETILFHHPIVANLDPTWAAYILYQYIMVAPGLDELTYAITNLGPHGWYQMNPITNDDGTPWLATEDHDGDGQPDNTPLYQYQIVDQVQVAGAEAMASVVNAIHNDPLLKDLHWTVAPGTATNVEDPSDTDSTSSGLTSVRSAATDGYTLHLSNEGYRHMFRTRVESQDGTNVKLAFSNSAIRHLTNFIRFYDENGTLLVLTDDEWSSLIGMWPSSMESADTKFMGISNPVTTILGIPITGNVFETTAQFTFPARARTAKISSGTLGTGGERDPFVEAVGADFTMALELALPTACLVMALGPDDSKDMVDLVLNTPQLASAIVQFMYGVLWSKSDLSVSSVLKKVGAVGGDVLARMLLNKAAAKLFAKIVTKKAAEDAVPFSGWAAMAADILCTGAMLAETGYAVLSSPHVIRNDLTMTHDITLTIDCDPRDYQFPATSTTYVVDAILSDSDTRTTGLITLPTTTVSDPIVVTFNDVPAGGQVRFDVRFYTSTGWMVARATEESRAPVANVNDAGGTRMTRTLTLLENLVPLNADSIYTHKQRLVYQGGKHAWQAGAAPTATAADLTATGLADLGNVTLLQKEGGLAYTWQGAPQGLATCASSTTATTLWTVQGISLKQDPEGGLQAMGCGTAEKPYVLYDMDATSWDAAQNLIVLPLNGRWYVRTLTQGTDKTFQVSAGSLGSFPMAVDSMVRHPQGILIAINHGYAKMYSLALADSPVADALAPEAVPVAGPAKTLDGLQNNPYLLRDPIALHVASDGAVLVLDDVHELTQGTVNEQVKARLKVFTKEGDPAPYFGGADHLDLVEPTANVLVRYLDFGLEGQGYIYVLSYAYPSDQASYQPKASDYRLDLFQPGGQFLARTSGFAAARLSVDLFRNVYSLNFETFAGPAGRLEPSISEWIPPTPPGP
jgi:hypothetical protein